MKGAQGEREFCCQLRAHLPEADPQRNLVQTRTGDMHHDLTGLEAFGVAVEVKRCETLRVGLWWTQTTKQARGQGLRPALAYRRSREPWTVLVAFSVAEFAALCRAGLTGEPYADADKPIDGVASGECVEPGA